MTDAINEILGESEEAATARVLERMRRYVEVETPSRNEAQIRALAALLAHDLRAAGADVQLIDAPGYGAHVVANLGGDGSDQIAILSHMDTVHPQRIGLH